MICELLMLKQAYSDSFADTTWHSHPTLQIGYVLAGEVIVHLSGAAHVMRRDSFYLITRHHLHRIETGAGAREWHGFVTLTDSSSYFTPAATSAIDWSLLDGRSSIVHDASPLIRWFDQIGAVQAWHHGVSNLFCQSLFVHLLTVLATMEATVVLRETEHTSHVTSRRRFQIAVRCIERLFTDASVTVEDLAAACSVSRSTLDKLFHAQLGYGPKQFLQRYRVDRAKELIAAGQYSMAEVARRTGFGDPYTFSRVFHRITGMSPSAYARVSV